MTWTRRGGIISVLLALSALGCGCCENEKQQIEYLTQQNQELTGKNGDLRSQLAECRTRESQLMAQMESKDLAMTALRTENEELKQRLSGGATAPVPTPGGGTAETTVYTETVGSDILFASGKASLSAKGKARLDRTISTLRSQYPGLGVRVYGYTDSDPIKHSRKLWQDNLDLSANRAMAVTRYLRSKGIDAERIETVAMGATNFVATNASKTGKAKNRRVVIKVVRK